MNKILALTTVSALSTVVALPLAPAAAATRMEVSFADTRVGFDSSTVVTSLADCPTATTEDRRARVAWLPDGGGVFFGIRDFQCSDDTGFVVRLTARFGEGGSTGTWSIVEGYGDLEGLHGSGTLVGVPLDSDGDGSAESIVDHYTGTVVVAP